MAQQIDKEEQKKLLIEMMEADEKDGLYNIHDDIPTAHCIAKFYLKTNNMAQPKLDSVSFEFSQEGNCVDSDEIEILNIRCESSLGIDNDGGCFYVLKTEQWSFDSIDDLQQLIDRVSKVVNK